MLEITRIHWHPDRALEVVHELAKEANRRAGERLLDLAEPHIPFETGALARSRMIVDDGEEAAAGYTARYAGIVRARGVALRGRDANWLEDAVDAGELEHVYGDTFRDGWPNR